MTLSKHYAPVTPGGAPADPAMRTVAALSNLVAERRAELQGLAPESVEWTGKRVVAVEHGGYELVELSRPVVFVQSTRPVTAGKFARIEMAGAELIDDFFAGGESWRRAHDLQVYDALLEMVRVMSPGGEGATAGQVFRGDFGEGGAAVGGTRGWNADELAAEIPLDRTVLPRSGFLSRVCTPLNRLTNLLLLYRRGGGHLRLEDVPLS